jgi:hypothetical protein
MILTREIKLMNAKAAKKERRSTMGVYADPNRERRLPWVLEQMKQE